MERLCIFSGSSPGGHPDYAEATAALGRALAGAGVGLVYGGARVALMGAMADAVLAAGGAVTGVMPEALVAKEVAHAGLTELHVVRSMHERKALMADLADAFVAMPGGWGTLDELFEILTWAQLGLHRKPCAVLNIRGYFDPLLAFLDHSVREGFVRAEHRGMLLVARAPGELLDRLGESRPPIVEKWITRADT